MNVRFYLSQDIKIKQKSHFECVNVKILSFLRNATMNVIT